MHGHKVVFINRDYFIKSILLIKIRKQHKGEDITLRRNLNQMFQCWVKSVVNPSLNAAF